MVKASNPIPRVLIATPVSERHGHLLNEWIAHLDSLTYPNFDVCLIDTTLGKDGYFNRLKQQKVKGKEIIALKYNWDAEKMHPLQMMAYAREEIRQYFLNNNYDYLFWLDDDIFVPKNAVQKLVSYNKEHVGFYVHVFFEPEQVPCVLKSGDLIMGKGLQYFSFSELDAYKSFSNRYKEDKLTDEEKLLVPFLIKDTWHPNLAKVYAVNIGCLLIKREIVEKLPYRTHPTFIFGEDLWYFNEANDKKFEFWVDTEVRAIHKNTEWNSVLSQSKRKANEFWVVQGPSNANEAEFIKR